MDISMVQVAKYIAYMLSIIVVSVFAINTFSPFFHFHEHAEMAITSTIIFVITLLCTMGAKKLNVFPKLNIKR
ncbi:hypothetical protein E5672_10160 [Alteromonas portus]|uniref:Uncharacterized protein n=1 Tax=Alteromonas portus TaxID=2565549 RepID=A0A4U0ZFN0_9ALTE|nr:hypothetical protein [Alteromonas portus]TKB03394.1 hypothetical protein E5672_10160 [Alteromonas portus]